jgi:hypothetical protein
MDQGKSPAKTSKKSGEGDEKEWVDLRLSLPYD